jgi:putative transport protein
MTGVMSGAVTNTPGLGAAQAAIKDLNINGGNTQTVTLAYAIAYPLGVFGIIFSLILLRKIFGINIEEKENSTKLNFVRSKKPVSIHLVLENKQLEK